jgi:Fur family peroxide stress response transcriptional regulator
MEKYRNLGIKLTPQRIAILSYLSGRKTHPSAEEIYRAVQKEFPTMSFATVYNTLDTLKEKGCLIEITIDPEKKRYESWCDPHHHLICVRCKSIIDIRKEFHLEISENGKKGFDVIGNHVEFYGVCQKCKKTKINNRDKKVIGTSDTHVHYRRIGCQG